MYFSIFKCHNFTLTDAEVQNFSLICIKVQQRYKNKQNGQILKRSDY